jgi:hypothetical protein
MVQERKFVVNHRDSPRAVLPVFARVRAQTDLDIRSALLGEGDHPPAPPVTAPDHSGSQGSSQMG